MPKSPNASMERAIRNCKRAGVTAADLWTTTKENVNAAAKKGRWLASERAMSLVSWQEAIEKVYRVRLDA